MIILAPASWIRRPMATGSRVASSNPLRVFAVTGRAVASTTALVMASTSPRSRRHPDPPFFRTTFFTGHPKLMSTKSGAYTSDTKAAASAITPGSEPKIWIPMGRSSSSNRRYPLVLSFPRQIPAALTNSLTTTSAPYSRQSRRKGDSLTPA